MKTVSRHFVLVRFVVAHSAALAIPVCAFSSTPDLSSFSKEEAAEWLVEVFSEQLEDSEPWHCRVIIEGDITLEDGKRNEYFEHWESWVDGRKIMAFPVSQTGMGEEAANRAPRNSRWLARYALPANLCIGCYSTDTLAYYAPSTHTPDKEESALAIYGEEKAESFFRLVDPRHIGLIPRQLGDLYDFKFKGFHEWQPEHLAVLNGQPTAGKVTVEAEAVPDNRVVFVLDEEANYLPKSIAHEFTLNGRVELHKIEIKYGAAGDSLLPTSTSYSQYMDGALVASEKCEVQTISYGEAFAPDLFSLSSMGIPTGTTVSWGYDNDPPGDPGRLRFDGREIVASREYDASKPRIAFADASAASRGAVWRLLFIVINCIIIAGLAVFIYHRRQSAK